MDGKRTRILFIFSLFEKMIPLPLSYLPVLFSEFLEVPSPKTILQLSTIHTMSSLPLSRKNESIFFQKNSLLPLLTLPLEQTLSLFQGGEAMSIITVNHLSKDFGSRQVLKDVSLEVKKGTVFGLLGPNGAGKTTLIECILGLKKPENGEALIFGQSARQQRKTIFEKVGVQLQASNFQNNIKVEELCQEMSALYQEPQDYQKLLEQFDLAEFQKQRADSLSGGQKQRLSLVLALLPNPEIVFLDELTTGLDTEARREVWRILRSLKKQGLTIFLTTHYLEEAEQLCDELVFLKKGQIIERQNLAYLQQQENYLTLEDYYLQKMEESA